jgi:hypothetical protein
VRRWRFQQLMVSPAGGAPSLTVLSDAHGLPPCRWKQRRLRLARQTHRHGNLASVTAPPGSRVVLCIYPADHEKSRPEAFFFMVADRSGREAGCRRCWSR